MKRITFTIIPRIIIFIIAFLNIGIFPLRASDSGSGEKSFIISTDIVQNPTFLEKEYSSTCKSAGFRKQVKLLSIILIDYHLFISSQETYYQSDPYNFSPYFINFRTYPTYPIPPPPIG